MAHQHFYGSKPQVPLFNENSFKISFRKMRVKNMKHDGKILQSKNVLKFELGFHGISTTS